ncbi:hypothetical protein Acr_03g0001980 [Actinidia rufa]|uniref:Uncharacterized protein n=1 Tax=Actinidia rufa TaxID=165716 RepID=A0A7J0EAA1_9ERIC|nr:hypothetical protein Acr_03g0001980 [Actinidia rufa]
MGGVGGQVVKRIPSIKFPLRYPKPSASGLTSDLLFSLSLINLVGSSSQIRAAPKGADDEHISMSSSDVPAAPINTAVGGKASLQPKRTPVSDREIDAILVSVNFTSIGWLLVTSTGWTCGEGSVSTFVQYFRSFDL